MKDCTNSNARAVACLLIATLAVAFSTPTCRADLYSGTATLGNGGLAAFGEWNDPSTSLSWNVTLMGSFYHYAYTFMVPNKDVSHFILQVSDTFTVDDILNLRNDDKPLEYDSDLLRKYSPDDPGNSNLGMPGVIFGLKFEGLAGGTEWSWSFDSPRVPVWGDFFAIDGKKPGTPIPYAYNSGFLVEPDVQSGHIAVPDTTVVPIPAAFLLGMIGLSVAGVKLRKHA